MKNNEIKKRLGRSIEKAPMDIFAKIQDTPVRKMEKHDAVTRQEPISPRPLLKPAALGAMAMLLLILAVGGWYQFTLSPDSYIYFDVNPGIEIVMNRREQVIDLIGINRDGERLAASIDYDGEDLLTVQNRILEEMVEQNIFEGPRQIMLVSTLHRNQQDSRRLAREFDQVIHRFFDTQEVELVVFRQTLTSSRTLEEFSETYNMSIGRMTFIRNLMVLDPDLELEDLVDRSLEELLIISMQTGLDLDRIIETDDDYEAFEMPEVPDEDPEEEPATDPDIDEEPEPAPEPTPEPAPQPEPQSRLSIAEVLQIATAETGGGHVFEFKYDADDREYEITLYHNGFEYEMEIDAVSGAVKDFDRDELDDDDHGAYQQVQNQLIGIEAVNEIVLARTGGGHIVELDLDEDDGRWLYEIEAVYGSLEYDLEIDARTGEILSFQRDD